MTFKRSVPVRMMIARDTGWSTRPGLVLRTWRRNVDHILELADKLALARLQVYTRSWLAASACHRCRMRAPAFEKFSCGGKWARRALAAGSTRKGVYEQTAEKHVAM